MSLHFGIRTTTLSRTIINVCKFILNTNVDSISGHSAGSSFGELLNDLERPEGFETHCDFHAQVRGSAVDAMR